MPAPVTASARHANAPPAPQAPLPAWPWAPLPHGPRTDWGSDSTPLVPMARGLSLHEAWPVPGLLLSLHVPGSMAAESWGKEALLSLVPS